MSYLGVNYCRHFLTSHGPRCPNISSQGMGNPIKTNHFRRRMNHIESTTQLCWWISTKIPLHVREVLSFCNKKEGFLPRIKEGLFVSKIILYLHFDLVETSMIYLPYISSVVYICIIWTDTCAC